jgi:hypothetical protein
MNPTLQFAEMIRSALAYLCESSLATLCLEVASTGEKVCQQLSEMAVTPSADSPAPPPPSVTPATATAAPTTLSLTTIEANISAYGAGVLWTTGGITDRKQAHEMTRRVLQLRGQEKLGMRDFKTHTVAVGSTSYSTVMGVHRDYHDETNYLVLLHWYHELRTST